MKEIQIQCIFNYVKKFTLLLKYPLVLTTSSSLEFLRWDDLKQSVTCQGLNFCNITYD